MVFNTIKKGKNKVANLQFVKQSNATLILNLINSMEPVSRAELASSTGMSPTTVSSLTAEMLEQELIIETGSGTSTTSGRKPIMLEINPEGGYVISLEMLREGFHICLYNLKCKLVSDKKIIANDYKNIGKTIVDATNDILNKRSISRERLLGICAGVPALIDFQNQKIISSTVIPIDNKDTDFFAVIKDSFRDMPVIIQNESSLCAYAEKEFGQERNISNLVFVDINVGIGAGIIIGDKMFSGAYGMAGEVGHMTIDVNGPRCKCGSKGCFEVMGSIPAMIQKIVHAIMSGRETMVKDMIGSDYNKLCIDVIKQALDREDNLVMEVVDDTAHILAVGINNIINILNPQTVVIGGEIIKLGKILLDKVKAYLSEIELKPNLKRVKIRFSSVGTNSVTLGGAKYVLDTIWNSKDFIMQ